MIFISCLRRNVVMSTGRTARRRHRRRHDIEIWDIMPPNVSGRGLLYVFLFFNRNWITTG